jgi:LEA14-like dessication related protein
MGGRAGVALAAALCVAACALVFRQPTVRVANVRVGSMSFQGGSMIVRVEVENPNGYALEAERFRYTLSFRRAEPDTWVALAEGGLPERIRFEGHDTTAVDVEVPFRLSALGSALDQLLRRGELDYRFTGELGVNTPLGGRQIPFDERGVFRPTP